MIENNWLKRFHRPLPLQFALVAPFVLQTVGVVALVGYLSYRSGQQTVEKIAYQLIDRVEQQVLQELDHYLQSAHKTNERHAAAIASSAIDLQNLDQLHQYLILQHRQIDELTTLLFGTPQGDLRVSHRVSTSDYGVTTQLQPEELPFEAGVSAASNPALNKTYSVDQAGNLGRYLETIANIDVRDRPWYRQAVEQGKAGWTGPFQIGSTNLLALNAYTPVYGDNNQLLGVFAVNISLNQLGRFLEDIEVGQSGEIFIIERSGLLITNSTPELSYSTIGTPDLDGQAEPGTLAFERRSPNDINNSTIQRAYTYLNETLGNVATIQSPQSLHFSVQGHHYFLAVAPYRDAYGLDWLVVTVIPEADFTAAIQQNIRTTIALCLLVLGGAIALGAAISTRVTTRISQLNQASRQLAAGDLTQQLPTNSPIAEVRGLAQSFNQMAEQLQRLFRSQVEVEAMHQSEARFQQLAVAVPGMIYTCTQHPDGSYSFEYVSAASQNILELEPAHLLADINAALALIHSEDRPAYEAAVAHSTTTLEPFSVVFRIITPSGQLKWLESSSRPLKHGDGSVSWHGILLDISERARLEAERKQAEQTLRENEARFQELMTASPSVIYIVVEELDGPIHFEFLSPAFEEIHGISVADAYRDASLVFDQIHPDDREAYREAVAASVSSQQPFRHEWRIITPSGQIKWLQANSRPSRRDTGETVWHGVVNDVSDRKQLEAALQHSEARTRDILNNALAAITSLRVFKDHTWQIDQVSAGAERISGYTAEELTIDNTLWISRIEPDDWQAIVTRVFANIFAGQTDEYEYRFRHKDESLRWISQKNHSRWDETQQCWVVTAFSVDITDHKKLELALQTSEAKLNDILDSARLSSIVQFRVFPNCSWEYEYQSPGCEALFGYTPQEICANKDLWMSQVVADDREAIIEPLFGEIFNGNSKTVEFRFHHKDGSIRWIAASYSSRYDEATGCWSVTGVSTDITPRKQAEDALRESEERLQLALESAHMGSWDWNIKTNQIRWSESLEKMMGLQVGTFDGQFETLVNLLHPDDRQRVLECITRCLEQRDEYDIEFRFIKPDGSIRWAASRGKALYDQAGQAVHMAGIDIDITDRKRIELALRQSEQKFRGAFDTITTGMSLISLAGGFQEVNSTLCKMLGYTEDELLSLRLEDVVHPLDQQIGSSLIEKMMAGEIPGYQVEKRLLHKDGHEIWSILNMALMTDADNHLLYLIAQITDISDRKQAEYELEQAKEEAEAANQAKSIFLANMSHELRTPLNAILGFSQIMRYSADLPDDYRDYVQLIHKSGNYLLKLINEILDLSKIEAGKLTTDKQPTDLFNQLCSVRNTLSERISHKRLSFHLEIRANVPQYVRVDAQKLEQVLLNLLSNAIKFTTVGHIALRVSVRNATSLEEDSLPLPHLSSCPDSCLLLFEVEDTGVGIAPQDASLIFEAFAQTFSGQQIREGTGLGLTISRRLVQLMGGEITVQSTLGQGSTFQFTVPVDVITKASVQSSQDDRHVIAVAPNQPDYRILVVDDQAENRLLLVRLLEQVGLTVRDAATGGEALSVWEQWQPHLIWMDIRLPEIDGYEVTRRIRTVKQQDTQNSELDVASSSSLVDPVPTPIIIALTAQALQSDRERALAAGCTDYISKPFQEKTLFHKMTEHLGLQFIYSEPDQRFADPLLAVDDFAIMPRDWVAELYEAAILCQEEAVDALLQQVPPEQSSFAHKIKKLAYDFEFQEIMDLAKIYLDTSSMSGSDPPI